MKQQITLDLFENLDEVTQAVEKLKQKRGQVLREFDDQIAKLQIKKNEELHYFDTEIFLAEEKQKELMGDSLEKETENFFLKIKNYDPNKQTSWKVTKDKEKEELMFKHLTRYCCGLVKKKETLSLDMKETKKYIANGEYKITEEGVVVDENGMMIPGLNAQLKEPEVKIKVKGVR